MRHRIHTFWLNCMYRLYVYSHHQLFGVDSPPLLPWTYTTAFGGRLDHRITRREA